MILFKEIFKSGGQLIKIEDLVKSTGIKERTLYRHIDKCESEGLLVKTPNYTLNSCGDVIRLPNTYSYLDVKYKVWIDDNIDITDEFAYSIQTKLGKVFSTYIKKKYTLIDIDIETLTTEEKIKYSGTKVFESIEAFGIKSKILMN